MVLCVLLLAACSKREAKENVDALPVIFPDYIGVTVPQNICPLNFGVEGATHIRAVAKNEKGAVLDVRRALCTSSPRTTMWNSPSRIGIS